MEYDLEISDIICICRFPLEPNVSRMLVESAGRFLLIISMFLFHISGAFVALLS